jgi:hypothetical protein
MAYYVQLLTRHNLEYTHLLQLVLDKLEDAKNGAPARLKIAKAIIITPNFENYFSKKIIDSAIF